MSEDLVKRLKELGISEGTARYALTKSNNDVERAANYVFSGNAGRDEVRYSPELSRVSSRPNLDPVPEHNISPDPSLSPDSSLSNGEKEEEGSPERSTSKGWKPLSRLRSKMGSGSSDDGRIGRGRTSQTAEAVLETDTNQQASELIRGAISNPSSRRGSVETKKNVLGLKTSGSGDSVPTTGSTSIGGSGLKIPSLIVPSQPIGSFKNKSPSPSPIKRSSSPFFRARKSREEARKRRDSSPDPIGPLSKDKETDAGAESDGESVAATSTRNFRPQVSAYDDDDDDIGGRSENEIEHDEEIETPNEDVDLKDDLELFGDDGDFFDKETTKNTSANAVYYEGVAADGNTGGDADSPTDSPINNTKFDTSRGDAFDNYGEETEQDLLGEGPNVVIAPASVFQQSAFAKKETTRSGLELETSRPVYARDRCTMTLTHGDPDGALEESGKRLRRYVVLSDLSEESRYAVEWAIGTVARDGDEVFLISVKEDESKVDPKSWSNSDRAQKLRVQKERQTTCLLLTRQVTGLLQRTRLNITVTCQFLHAKNARHMLLDMIDFLEPTMVIVGSRGLGKLKGILLGSTSHYLVQKSSVPVMVARRRLQRPLRHTNPADLRHAPRVSLASASIEKTASSKQEDEVVDLAEAEGGEGDSPDKRRQSAPALTSN